MDTELPGRQPQRTAPASHRRQQLSARAAIGLSLLAAGLGRYGQALLPRSEGDTAPLPFTLLEKRRQSADAWLLRFALPRGRRYLGQDPRLPTGISVSLPAPDGDGFLYAKSYSPVSHPATKGSMDLVVKAYPPREGGGLGAYICGLAPGERLFARVKPPRLIHGDARVLGRWDSVGLVAGGTGVAPLLQLARLLLGANDARVRLLSINRRERDILLKEEIEDLAREHPGRFSFNFSLTGRAPWGWPGFRGRGTRAMAMQALPRPTWDGRTMILVCGRDGFVASWAGPLVRGPATADGKKGPKTQGPLLGLLRQVGYRQSEVYKY